MWIADDDRHDDQSGGARRERRFWESPSVSVPMPTIVRLTVWTIRCPPRASGLSIEQRAQHSSGGQQSWVEVDGRSPGAFLPFLVDRVMNGKAQLMRGGLALAASPAPRLPI
jgi:hypothetical protein